MDEEVHISRYFHYFPSSLYRLLLKQTKSLSIYRLLNAEISEDRKPGSGTPFLASVLSKVGLLPGTSASRLLELASEAKEEAQELERWLEHAKEPKRGEWAAGGSRGNYENRIKSKEKNEQ